MFSEIPINSDLWYVFRKNKLEYVHLRATSHVSKFARLRSWNIKGLEKKAGHESPAFFFSTNTTYQLFPVGPQEMAAWFTEMRWVGWFSGFLGSCFDPGWDTWKSPVSSHGG